MNKLRIWLTMLCALVGVSSWAVEFSSKDAYSIKSGGQYATTTTTTANNDGNFSSTYTMSSTAESFVMAGNETDGWTIKSISTNKWLGYGKSGNGGWNSGNAETYWDIASTTATQILRHVDTTKGLKVENSKMYTDATGTAISSFDFTKTHQNVTVRFMAGSSSVGTADGWVALGATVEDFAKANVPEGYILAGGTYATVVEGTYSYTVEVNAGVNWIAKAQTIYDAVSVVAGCVGSYNATPEQVSGLKTAIDNNDNAACQTLVQAIGEKIAFNNKTVYAAKNVNTSLYLRAMDDNLLWAKAGVEYADNDARFQWMVYKNGTDYILYNIAQGGWANNTNSAANQNKHWQIVTDQSAMSYVEIVDAGTMFSFRDKDHTGITVACLHNNISYNTGITNWNPAPGSTGSGWRFFPIETLSDEVTASVTTLQAYSANKKLIQPYIEIYNNLNMVGYKAATETQKTELAGYIKDCKVTEAEALVATLGECVLSNSKKYHVYTKRGNLYTDGTVASASTTSSSEWAVLKYQDTDHYYFYDVTNSKFLGTADLNSLDAPDNNYKVELWGTDKTEHKFTSMANNKLLQMNGVPQLTVTSDWTTKDDGDTWFIKEAGDFDATAAMAIVDFYENGKDKLALATAIATAQAYPTGTEVGYYNSTSLTAAIAAAQAVYDAATSTKDDYIAAKAALETAAANALIIPDASKYYYIQNANPAFFEKQGVNKGMYQTGSAPGWNTLNNADLNFVWTWTTKGAGWAVKNVGGGKYLDTTSAMNASEPTGVISLVWLAGGEWNIKATGGGTMHANSHSSGAGVSGNIVAWEGGAGSFSSWKIIELTTADITALADAQIEDFNNLGGTGIGYYVPTEEGYNAAKAAKETLEGDKTNMANVIALNAAIKAAQESATVKLPATKAFYRLKGGVSGKYATADPSSSVGAAMVDEAGANTIFYLDENNALINYTKGVFMKETSQAGTPGETAKDAYTFSANDEGAPYLYVYAEHTSTAGKWLYDHGANGYLNRNGSKHANTKWIVEEVTSLPVTIGSSYYATVNLPVPTIIPSDVEAWVAESEASGKLVLKKITDGVLPADCPVILYAATAGTYNFLITDDAGTFSSIFSGTTAAITNPSNVMVLGKNGETVALYPYTGAYIPGFKMYYQGTADEVRLDFNATTTAIEAAKRSDMREGEMYNINGQQVTKANGLVIVNGKKFVVK